MAAFGQVAAGARLALLLALVLGVTACTTIYRNHGYAPTAPDLAAVTVGQTTREELPALIGRPSSSGVLSTAGWYYVQSRWQHYAYRAPREIERQVVAISFTDAGVVSNVEQFGLQDGRVIALSRRVTQSNIKGLSIITQLLGSAGRLDAGQLLQQ